MIRQHKSETGKCCNENLPNPTPSGKGRILSVFMTENKNSSGCV